MTQSMTLHSVPPTADRDDGDEPGAATVRFVLDHDRAELSVLRADVARWVSDRDSGPSLVDRARLVASEMATVAIDHGAAGKPIEVELRRTHSILVIETTFEAAIGSPVGVLIDRATNDGHLELRVIENLTDRLTTRSGGRRVTLCSTFHLPHST